MMLYNYYKSTDEKKSLRAENQLSNQKFWTVLNQEGTLVNVQEIIKSKPLTLIIMISLKSCPACMYERRIWNEISTIKNVNVFGVLKEKQTTESDVWISNLELNFPVYYDTSGYIEQIQKELEQNELPLKILTDSTGRVLSNDGSHVNINEQDEWFKKIKNEFILLSGK